MVFLESTHNWDPGILVLTLAASGYATLEGDSSALACIYKSMKRMRDSVHLSIVAIVPLWRGALITGRVCMCGDFLFVVV